MVANPKSMSDSPAKSPRSCTISDLWVAPIALRTPTYTRPEAPV